MEREQRGHLLRCRIVTPWHSKHVSGASGADAPISSRCCAGSICLKSGGIPTTDIVTYQTDAPILGDVQNRLGC